MNKQLDISEYDIILIDKDLLIIINTLKKIKEIKQLTFKNNIIYINNQSINLLIHEITKVDNIFITTKEEYILKKGEAPALQIF